MSRSTLGDRPVTFYSPREQQQYMKARGIESFVRHVPVPGSDKSPYTTSWAGIAPETLAGATAMLERVGKSARSQDVETYVRDFTCTITDVVESVRGSLT
jgi:hypothetical protein